MKITVLTIALSLWLYGVAAAQVIRPKTGQTRLASDRRILILKVDAQTVGATQFVVGVETVPPGAPFPTHKHPDQEELLFVHTGTLTVTLGDAPLQEAGAVVCIPQDTWIGGANRGAEPAAFVFIFPQTGIAELRYEGVTRHVPPPTGSIMLVPADSPSLWRWRGHNDALHVYLEPGVVERVAAEAFDLDPARLTIPPLDGLDLPPLRTAMLAVDAELIAGGAGGTARCRGRSSAPSSRTSRPTSTLT